MFVVGLSGGIGSGKSTVASLFSNIGIEVIDADQLARDIVSPSSPALEKIIENFGSSIVNADGTLNRTLLREKIFNDLHSKIWLEELLHPLIHEAATHALQNTISAYAIYMAPLLLENGLQNFVDRILIVDVDETQQLTRSMSRDSSSREKIQKIMESQWSRQQRLEAADDIIDNSGGIDELASQVYNLHQHYLKLANANKP